MSNQLNNKRVSSQSTMELVCVEDYEKKASTIIEPKALDYYRSGAGAEFSLHLNREAFKRWRLRPRVMRDVSNLDTVTSVLGERIEWPVGIAPTAMQKLAHVEGEIANARAAGAAGTIFVLSTLSTTSLEEVAAAAPDTCKWFQLYIYKNRELSLSLLRRAEAAHYKAMVLTVDSPVFSAKRANARNNFKLPPHLGMANFYDMKAAKDGGSETKVKDYVSREFDASLTWNDVAWLVGQTSLPVIAKGILSSEDAVLAHKAGCRGIIVSNHGARQLDGVPATIEVLPEIVAELSTIAHGMAIMMDGGISQGIDVFRALALGADMVFVGRPAIWGLACHGQKGVEAVLGMLRKELEVTMALAGCPRLGDITREMVAHESRYYKQ